MTALPPNGGGYNPVPWITAAIILLLASPAVTTALRFITNT